MQISAGSLFASTPSMGDPIFYNTVIFIAEYNARGALGFIINRPFERPLNELVEFSSSPAFPLWYGGPVDNEHLYFIHRQRDMIPGGSLIANDVFLGGDFKTAVQHINNKALTTSAIRIFVGYCGWDAGELEAEIAEGSWEPAAHRFQHLF